MELLKLAYQRIFYIALAIIVLTLLGSIFLGRQDGAAPPNSFTLLSRAIQNAFKITALFILILGCLSISSEVTGGTIKTILINPIRRSELFIGKVIAMVITALLLALLIEILSFGIVWLNFGFSDIADPAIKNYIHLHKSEMLRYTGYTFVMIFLPLVSIGFFGIFISSLIENAGIAVASGILVYLFVDYFIIPVFPDIAPYLFNYYLDFHTRTLIDLSEGILGEIPRFTVIDYLLGIKKPGEETVDYMLFFMTRIVPLSYVIVFFFSGLFLIKRKDII